MNADPEPRTLDPAARRRLDNCLALGKRGATPGERAAGKAAAERIAASAGLTLAKAKAQARGDRPGDRVNTPRSAPAYPWAKPKEPSKPLTVEELLRQKAKTAAWRKRRSAAADRRMAKELAEQAAYEAEQRELQAERDRVWAAARAASTAQPGARL